MSRSHSPVRAWRFIALAMVLALVAAACGGGTSDETTTTAAGAETTTTVAGGGDETTTTEGAPDEEPAGGDTLTIAWQWDPGTMDPQMHRQRYTQIISTQLRDRLYITDVPGLTQIPWLGDSLVQVDDTTYEMTIQEGVLFHNGDELTAEDVAFTFQRLWDPANESPRASMGNMTNVESIEAVDRYTVRWTTEVPFGEAEPGAVLGFHLAGQEMLHKATYETLSLDEASGGDHVVGTGPFKLVEWVPDQRVVMEAFEDYWDGAPLVDQLIWRTVPEEATRTAELLAGSVDMIYPVTPDFVSQLEDAGMKLEIQPGTSQTALHMNVRDGSPFADPEVRRAMNQAIDKEALVQAVYSGLAVVSHQVPGPGQQGFIDGYQPFDYDPDAAREVLSGVTEPIELFTEPQYELAAEVIAETLRGYGMDVSTAIQDPAAMAALGESGDYDLSLASAGYGSGDFTGAYFNNQFECVRMETDRVRTGFCDEELDALIEEVRGLPFAEQDELLAEVVQLLTEVHMPWVPLYARAETWAMQPYVNGFTGSSQGQMYHMHKVSLDK